GLFRDPARIRRWRHELRRIFRYTRWSRNLRSTGAFLRRLGPQRAAPSIYGFELRRYKDRPGTIEHHWITDSRLSSRRRGNQNNFKAWIYSDSSQLSADRLLPPDGPQAPVARWQSQLAATRQTSGSNQEIARAGN